MLLKRVLSLSIIAVSLLNADWIRDDSLEVVKDTTNNLMWQDNEVKN